MRYPGQTETEKKWSPEDIFKLIFCNENCGTWIQISLKYVSIGPVIKKARIDSENGLVSIRQEAIISTNGDLGRIDTSF